MKLKIRQTEIEISYLLLCAAAAAVILDVFRGFVFCAAAVIVHESGHLLMMKKIGYFPKRIKISLALIGMATIIGATAVAARKAYDWGYSLTEGFFFFFL